MLAIMKAHMWSHVALHGEIFGLYMGVSLNGGAPKTPQIDHI